MRKMIFALWTACLFFACSDPEAERVIAEKQKDVSGIESQIEKTKFKLDSLKSNDAALRDELNSLDMAR